MAISDRLNKLTTDITNAYASIENKGGTTPANKNTNNLPTAIDSIEVIEQATAEGESLSLANTKAMPYKDYVVEGKSVQEGEPSPSNPSEIYSVGDVVLPSEYQQVEYITSDGNSYIDTNLQITGDFEIDLEFIKNQSLSGEQPIISIWTPQYNYWNLFIRADNYLEWYVNGHYVAQYVALTQGEKNQIKLKRDGNSFIFSQNGSKIKFSYSTDNNTSTLKLFKRGDLENNSYVSIGKVTIKKNNILVKKLIPCYKISDNTIGMYDIINDVFISNSGTGNFTKGNFYIHSKDIITIKQRGKNLWNEELEDAEYDNNGNKQDATIWLVNKNKINVNPNTTYTISQQQTPSQYRIICLNNNTFLEWISSVQDITTGYKNYTFTTPANCNKIYIQFRSIIEKIAQGNYNMIPSDITNIQLEQGSTATSYEPYQANDYTIQTEPLRSLPNGVKDTIEADGIHRRVGRVVLDGSEDENWRQYTGGFQYTYHLSISNCKGGLQESMCSHFQNVNYCWEANIGQVGRYSDHPTITNKYFNTDKSTLASWKEWLQENPITLTYELAEEVIEPLTQNQANTMLDIIKTGSYEGTTNIYTDEDVKPTIGVGYYKKG